MISKQIGVCMVKLKTWLYVYKEAMRIFEIKQTHNRTLQNMISNTICLVGKL